MVKNVKSSQDSDTEFFVNAVNAMDHEEEEEDHFLAGAVNAMDREEEEEDEFLADVPYAPPPATCLTLILTIPCSLFQLRTQMRCPLWIMTPLHPHSKLVRNHTPTMTTSLTEMTSTTAWGIVVQVK